MPRTARQKAERQAWMLTRVMVIGEACSGPLLMQWWVGVSGVGLRRKCLLSGCGSSGWAPPHSVMSRLGKGLPWISWRLRLTPGLACRVSFPGLWPCF